MDLSIRLSSGDPIARLVPWYFRPAFSMRRLRIKASHPQFSCGYQLWRLPFSIAFLYHLLSTFEMWCGICDDVVSLDFNGSLLLYFGANPNLQARSLVSLAWSGSQLLTKNDLLPHDSSGSLDDRDLCLYQPSELLMKSLVVSGLNQADSKMQVTRTQVENATATDYNVSNGVTMIHGDSVN